jgi:hypothetical protein
MIAGIPKFDVKKINQAVSAMKSEGGARQGKSALAPSVLRCM